MKKGIVFLAVCAFLSFNVVISEATEVILMNITPVNPWVGNTITVDLVMGPVLANSTEKVLVELLDNRGKTLINNSDHPWNTVHPPIYWEKWPYNWSYFVSMSGVTKIRVSISDNGGPFIMKKEVDYLIKTSPLNVLSLLIDKDKPTAGLAIISLSIGPIAAGDSAEVKIILLNKENNVIGDNSDNAKWNFVRPDAYWSAWAYSWVFALKDVQKMQVLLSQNGGLFELKRSMLINPPNIIPIINLLLSD